MPLVFAVDQVRGGDYDHDQGITADRYHVRGRPCVFLIDRDGKIALSPGDPSIVTKVQAAAQEAGIDLNPQIATDEQAPSRDVSIIQSRD